MDSLETIAGGLAHEINNPLNYVKNALARVRMDAQALLEKKEMSAEELQKLDKRVRDLFQVRSRASSASRARWSYGQLQRAGYTPSCVRYDPPPGRPPSGSSCVPRRPAARCGWKTPFPRATARSSCAFPRR